MSDLILPPSRSSAPRDIVVFGAHRGAIATQPALAELPRDRYRLTYVDPVPGRATALAEPLRKRGFETRAFEERLESFLERDLPPPALAIFQLDRAAPIARGLEHADRNGYAVLGFQIIEAPRVGIFGLRFAHGAGERESNRRLHALFSGTAAVSSREGSERFFGEGAPPERIATEERMRSSFRTYVVERIDKLAAGLEPSGAPIEATMDGLSTRPVAVLADDVLDEEPHRVAARVLDERHIVPRRGTPFVVMEVGRFPEPAVRTRAGTVRKDHLLQVGAAKDLVMGEADAQARRRLALSRTEPRPGGGLDMAAVLGLALVASTTGIATSRFPLATTD